MNLLQAMQDARERRLETLREEETRAEIDRRLLDKVNRFFHDCGPGCTPAKILTPDFQRTVMLAGPGAVASPNPADHVPLHGTRPTCRVLYHKSLRFFAAGRVHRERLFLAANRIGKTETAGFEMRCHLTGLYPKWWPGVKFEHPIEAWAAGDTRQTTRDIIQQALMGKHEGVPLKKWGGMLDPHLIVNHVRSTGGVANCLDTVYVQHVERVHGAPAVSELAFKSYDQGRRVFQGTEKNLIWLDEEPPDAVEAQEAEAQGSSDIWTECLLRTMTRDGGMLMATFTPLRGLTPFLGNYISTAVMPGTEDEGAAEVDAKSHFYPDVLDLSNVQTEGAA